MSKRLQFLWIDDLPSRRVTADNMKRKLNVRLDFTNVRNTDIDTELRKIQEMPEPDLIILDHKLEEIRSGLFRTGSTVAAYLREKWPECPMIGITAANVRTDVDFQQREAYEEIYPSIVISRHYQTIYSIAKSFKILREKKPTTVDSVLGLMKTPKDELIKIKSIVPQDFRNNINDPSILVDLSRWVRKIFLDRPGFVYDRLWAATFLGLTTNGFQKVEQHFKKAKYTGLFADESNTKWWKSRLLQVLSDMVDTPGLPWEKGRHLPDIKSSDYSKCYATGEFYPETVAFIDDSITAERAAMRLKNTVPHPNFEDLLFFEEMRMMKPA